MVFGVWPSELEPLGPYNGTQDVHRAAKMEVRHQNIKKAPGTQEDLIIVEEELLIHRRAYLRIQRLSELGKHKENEQVAEHPCDSGCCFL